MNPVRYSGLANIVGSVLVVAAILLHPPDSNNMNSSLWVFVHILLFVSLLLAILGLFGLYAKHSARSSGLAFSGFILTFIGLACLSGLMYFEAFLNPILAVEAPTFIEKYGAGQTIGLVKYIFPISGLAFMVGYILLAISVYRAGEYSLWVCGLLIFGVILFGLGLGSILPKTVGIAGSILFATGLGKIGYSLWSEV